MKKISALFCSASMATLFLTSCGEKSQFDGFVRAENGLHYKFFTHDENGPKPAIGDFVMLRYQFKVQRNDSTFMDSKDASREPGGLVEINMKQATFKGCLEDGITMMAKGDSAAFIVRADSFFMRTMQMNELPPFIKADDYVKAVIKLDSWKNRKEVEEARAKEMAERQAKAQVAMQEEQGKRDKYIADNKIKVQPSATGLYYIETKKGNGNNPKPTDIVTVHYTGKLLDGTVFDSSVQRGQPAEFPLNGVIAGWIEGLQLMKKGGKATLIIPSALAYGGQEGGPIPPFSTLLFDVELIDIKDGASQMGPMPAGGGQQHSAGDGHNH